MELFVSPPIVRAGANADWSARVWAPFNERGWVEFALVDPSLLTAQPLPWPRKAVEAVRSFITTFCALVPSVDLTPYQETISDALVEGGFDGLEENLILAWPVMIEGLSALACSMDRALTANGEVCPVLISPMHIWALAEAARVFIFCIDPGCEMPEWHEMARDALEQWSDQSMAVTGMAHPYSAVVIRPLA